MSSSRHQIAEPPSIVDDGTKPHRVRASEAAITATLRAIREAGLNVARVCITGGKVEIHCGQVESRAAGEEDGGLEEW